MATTACPRDADHITLHIIKAVATATDTDPLTLEPPLYNIVEPEALASLVENGGIHSVEFEYNGQTVTVDGDGSVAIDGTVYEP